MPPLCMATEPLIGRFVVASVTEGRILCAHRQCSMAPVGHYYTSPGGATDSCDFSQCDPLPDDAAAFYVPGFANQSDNCPSISCASAPPGYQLSSSGTCAIEPCRTAKTGEYYTDSCNVSMCYPPGPGRLLLDGTINTAGARTSPDSCLSGTCGEPPLGKYYGSEGCAQHNCTNAPPGSCYLGHGGVDGNCPYAPCTNDTIVAMCPDSDTPPVGWHFNGLSGMSQAERCRLVPCPIIAGKRYLSHAQDSGSCDLVRADCTNARLGEAYVNLDLGAISWDSSTSNPHVALSCATVECSSECPTGKRLSEPGSCICVDCPVPELGYYHASSNVTGECAYARCNSPGIGEIAGVGHSFSPSECPMLSCYRPPGSTFSRPADCQAWAFCSNNLPPGRYYSEGKLGPVGECPTSPCTAELELGEVFVAVGFATADSHCHVDLCDSISEPGYCFTTPGSCNTSVCRSPSPPFPPSTPAPAVTLIEGGGGWGSAAAVRAASVGIGATTAFAVLLICLRRRRMGRLFLSYRVNADARLVEKVYDKLKSQGVDVWWDKKCLEDGRPWEDSFADGLMGADVFVPFLSKTALAPFAALAPGSRCDNVLLEYRLAAELKARGKLRAIFPVFVGEPDGDGFGDFFAGGGDPKAPDVQVSSVEDKVEEHLARNGWGASRQPREERTVKAVMDIIKRHQGVFLKGSPEGDVIEKVVAKLKGLAEKSGRPMFKLSRPLQLRLPHVEDDHFRSDIQSRGRIGLRRPQVCLRNERIGRAEMALRI